MEQPPGPPLSLATEQSGTSWFSGWFPAPRRLPTGLTLHSEPGTWMWDGTKGSPTLCLRELRSLNPSSDPVASVKLGMEGKSPLRARGVCRLLLVLVGTGGEGLVPFCVLEL